MFQITWTIDADDDDKVKTPQEAAEYAFRLMRDEDSLATVFEVTDFKTGNRYDVDMNFEEQRTVITDKTTGEIKVYNL
jgi:hypothetical protein